MKRFGLGKGISALIPQIEAEGENIKLLNIEEIKPNPLQPRKEFNEAELQNLSDSIKEKGILQPLLVRRKEQHFELVSGERRWRAAKIAKIKEVPVIIKEYSDNESLEISMIENLQREDLNPIEKAEGYKKLIEKFNLTQEELSKRISKSRSEVANTLRLLNLPEFIKRGLIEGKITEGHARCLLSLFSLDLQNKVYYQIILKKLSVRQTENIVRNLILQKERRRKKKHSIKIFITDLCDRLSSKLSTKVSIVGSTKKGKLSIEYYSQEDLERIVDIILR